MAAVLDKREEASVKGGRRTIPQKVRFEVFKRDSFICQYCGKTAPDALLQVDHIIPVAQGGSNDILNLVTSCWDCNSGKSDRLLSEHTSVAKAKRQADELQQKREQLEMMAAWIRSCSSLDDDAIQMAVTFWNELTPGWQVTSSGIDKIRGWFRKFGLKELMEAMRVSADAYLRFDSDGKLISESWQKAFDKIPGVCFCRREEKTDPTFAERYRLRGRLYARYQYVNNGVALGLIDKAREKGIAIQQLRAAIDSSANWSAWRSCMEDMIEEAKRNGSSAG